MGEMKMSKPYWKTLLKEKLNQTAQTDKPRIAIIGIGSDLHGDDGIGPFIIKQLQEKLLPRADILLLEGGVIPENVTGPIRRFGADIVLLIDAADLSLKPGSIRLIDPGELIGLSFSSHTMPLGILVEYLIKEFCCEVILLGIQAESTSFGSEPSLTVVKSAKRINNFLFDVLNS